MLCAGAQNVDGFAAWTNCVLIASKDESVVSTQREKSKRDFGWTDAHLDLIQELKTSMVPVWDFKNGMSVGCANDNMPTLEGGDGSPTRGLLVLPYTTAGVTYTQVRSTFENMVLADIEEANSKLG